MDIKEIVEKNNKFSAWKADIDKKVKDEKDKIFEINSDLNMDEFMALDYEEAKDVYKALEYNLSYGEERDRVYKALHQVKIKKYPILSKAHYYPVINEIEYLTDSQKNKLDEILMYFAHKEIMTQSNAWRELNLSRETTEKVLEFLYDKGLVSKSLYIRCQCGRGGDIMTEASYNDHKKYFNIEEKLREGTETEQEHDWYEKFEENGRDWMVGCWNCEGRELLSMNDIDENSTTIYKSIVSPDRTYADM